jgi:hypothetical protein
VESSRTPRSCFTNFKENTTIFKGKVILKTDCMFL